ncbi:MAG: hypothetical protein KA334_00745, partial [Opitutaceae bacterium]|nr:hypothetical protein [Opitutaceae bacterium]
IVVWALAPLVQAAWARAGVYLLLLCNPMSYEMVVLGRVLRQNIYTPLALVVFAGLIALYTRRAGTYRQLVPWGVALGLAGAAFWLTREESVWLAPSVALRAGAALWGARQHGGLRQLRHMGSALGVAVVCSVTPLLVVSTLNARFYGYFGIVEFNAREFKDAYGSLMRVEIGPKLPFIPVSRAAREAIYEASPAFAELRPFLEGDIGRGWAAASQCVTHRSVEDREIAGGWFMWALRDAVAATGHTHSAKEALAFYKRIAAEVNQSCAEGRLAAGPPRSGMLPPWRTGQTQALASTFVEFADFFASFRGFNAHSPASMGDTSSLQLFHRMTRERLSPSPDGPATREMDAPSPLDQWRTAVLQRIGKALRWVLFSLTIAAHAGAIWLLIQQWRQRRISYYFIVAVASWGACAASLLINALVHITSFPTLATGQFAAAYPLLLLFIAAIGLGVARADAIQPEGVSKP